MSTQQVVLMEEVGESYFFNWDEEPPYTNDPKYAGQLTRGQHNRVLVNGTDIGTCQSLQTGKNGWVERQVRHKGTNRPVVVIKCRIDPNYCVRSDSPEWETELKKYPYKVMAKQQDDGTITPTHDFYEEFLTEVLTGHVEFIIDESRRE